MSELGKPFPKRSQIKQAENQKQKIVFGQKPLARMEAGSNKQK